MPHPKVRTWTLKTLDRDRTYVLWFDEEAFRWEVRPYGSTAGPLTTRPERPAGRGAPRRAPAPEGGAAGGVARRGPARRR
jgi:hypothetical protein